MPDLKANNEIGGRKFCLLVVIRSKVNLAFEIVRKVLSSNLVQSFS